MDLSEFKKGDFWPEECPYWTWRKKVSTPVGKFTLALVFPPGDKSMPDARMCSLAMDLIEFAKTNTELLTDIAHDAYKLFCKNDSQWVIDCGVPLGLARDQIWKYLPRPGLTISKLEANPQSPYPHEHVARLTQAIDLRPDWDEEHGLGLEIENGKITMINDEPFQTKA